MKNNNTFKFEDLSAEEKKQRGILGRLYGPCASIAIPTRNGRFYSEKLWEKVFSNNKDSIVTEMFENGGIPMELDHPTDREETCSDRIAAMLPEPPQKDNKGQLVCYVDLIDTPCGKIAYQLAKYGFNLGISSRGSGDVIENLNGQEEVDCDTYNFQTFDLVLLPAVKSARLKLMTESLNGKTLKESLDEEIAKCDDNAKQIMLETLSNLNIDYKCENIDNKKSDIAANNAGAIFVKELQDSLLAQQKLEAQVTELQEKLSVCYAKEAKYDEDIAKYKVAIRNLSESTSNAKALQTKVNLLTEELNKKDTLIKAADEKYNTLLEKQSVNIKNQSNLTEAISDKDTQLREANNQIKTLNENLNSFKAKSKIRESELKESLEEAKKNLTIKSTEYKTKLSNSNKLVEQYRTTAKTAVNKYIDLQSMMLGINSSEIKNKLPEHYSFDDIDTICEGLKDFKLRVSKLPIDIQTNNVRVSVKESIEPIMPKSRFDDSVDESLLTLAGLKK